MSRMRRLKVRLSNPLDLVRPLLPAWAYRKLATIRTRQWLSDQQQVDRFTAEMSFLLAETGRASEIEQAATKNLTNYLWRSEIRWHPRRVTRQRVEGAENLRSAHALGRGVVLNFMHHGQYDGVFASVRRATGIPISTITAAETLTVDTESWRRQHAKLVAAGGETVTATVGLKGIVERLRHGQVIAIASDVAGGTEVQWAGRRVGGASGAVRAASMADAPVVLLTSHLGEDGEPYVRLSEPIEPTDYATVEALLQAVVADHESAVLAWPDGAHLPASRWRILSN